MEEITEVVNNIAIAGDAQKKNRIQDSNTKKPLFFYVNLAKRYMQQHNEVELFALKMICSRSVVTNRCVEDATVGLVRWKIETVLKISGDTFISRLRQRLESEDEESERRRERGAAVGFYTHLQNGERFEETLEEVQCPKHWMLDKLGGAFAPKPPSGFCKIGSNVVSVPKTNENFRLLYDTKGRFRLHSIRDEEAKFKLCLVRSVQFGKKGIPYLNTYGPHATRTLLSGLMTLSSLTWRATKLLILSNF
ncbi:hypothetical protein C2S51_020226 [Perilla frutescens var. frutescens]|nr:hypothetical protein C2S51_020226 [Perilla frutescens var. frutescens]